MSTPVRTKKPPVKRASSPGGSSQSGKKKRPATPVAGIPASVVDIETVSSNASSPAASEAATETKVQYVFKDPNFVHSTKGAANNKNSKKIRVWKNLKQITTAERALSWNENDVIFSGIDAPPSFSPAKKYSDITGLMAKYTDPQTKIRYASTEEFTRIRLLPSDLITGYLTLRKASIAVP